LICVFLLTEHFNTVVAQWNGIQLHVLK